MGRACLIGLVFGSPLAFLPATLDQFNLTKLALLWALGSLALGAWAVWSLGRRAWLPPVRLLSCAGLFLVACALATALSLSPALSLVGLYGRYGGLFPLLLYVGIMTTLIGLFWERPEGLGTLAWAAVAAAPVLAAYLILQAHGYDFVQWGATAKASEQVARRNLTNPIGTMGNSNFAGGYLGIVAPLLVYAAARARRSGERATVAIAAAIVAWGLWVSRSRGGLVAAAAGMVVMAVLHRHRVSRPARLAILAALLVAGAGAVAVTAPRLAAPAGGPGGVLRADTLVSRSWYWRSAWALIEERPVLGHGLDTFFSGYPRHRLAADGAEFGLVLADKPHDILLEYGANAGFLGLGTYLLTVVTALVWGFRRVSRIDGHERLLLAAFLAVLTGYLAQGLFSIDVPPLAITGWVALGAIAVLADPGVLRARRHDQVVRRRPDPGADSRRARRAARHGGRRPLQVGVAVVAAAAATVAAVPLLADHEAKEAYYGIQALDLRGPGADGGAGRLRLAAVLDARARRAMRLDGREAAYRSVAGELAEYRAKWAPAKAEKGRFLRRAAALHQEALSMRPGHIYYMIAVARARTTLAEEVDPSLFPQAEAAWAHVVAFDHTDWEVHGLHATMLNSWANAAGGDAGLRRRTAQELEEVVRIRPREEPSWVSLGQIYTALGESVRAEAALRRALALQPGDSEAKALLQNA